MTGGVRPSGPLPAPDEWRRLEPLIDTLLDTPPERRPAVLAELSGGDATRHRELERMLDECEGASPLIDQSVAERFTSVFGDEVPQVPASLAGRYEIVREAGRGGMAIVYVARDLKHGRDVAVKVVRPEVAAALGRDRFLREIAIAARLRHPNIVPLYDSGDVGTGATDASLLYYVMPYEAGHSLRERLDHEGPLPVEDALAILGDVCEALAHAHHHGIVHRDIKPDNVLLAGRHAIVTDFGVAHALTEATADTTPAAGCIAFGTARYMAPEQASNDPGLDQRADIYAVGVMAYEILTGRTPVADDVRWPESHAHEVEVRASLLSQRPDIPEALADAITKCLARQPAERWQTADELRTRLASVTAATAVSVPPAAAPPPRISTRSPGRVLVALGAATVVVLLAILGVFLSEREAPPMPLVGRQSRLTSEPGLEVQPVMSPDGAMVAYAAGHSLRMHIVVRPVVGGRDTRLTPDTTNAWMPRWSPDGRRILYLSRGGVYSVSALGGPAREEVAGRPGTIVTSATWSPDGREIAYARADSLLSRDVRSGTVRLITTATDLHSCDWSPNGDRLACVSGNSFYVTVGAIFGLGPMFGNLAPSRIVLVPAAGGTAANVTDSLSLYQSPAWSRDGRTLFYVSNAQGPRDVYALEVDNHGAAVGEPVRVTTGIGAHSISFSADRARIAYAAYTSSANVWAMPIPREGVASSACLVPVTSGNQTAEGVRVSVDGQWVVYDSDLSGNSDIYRVPATGGEPERLTRSPVDEFRGTLSPNGKELAYHTFQTGSRNMFLLSLDRGSVEQITHSSGHLSMANWSPDGSALTLFDMATSDVLVMRRDERGRWGPPRFVAKAGWRPEWSPDGRTIAFVSPTDGRIGVVPADSGAQRDIYVPADNDPLAELAIFSRDGGQLYFKSHDAEGRASFWAIPAMGGRPRLVARFDDPSRASNRFEFASDGQRFYFTIEDRQSDIWVAEVPAPHRSVR